MAERHACGNAAVVKVVVVVVGGSSVSRPASPFMSPPLPLTQLCSVCKQTRSTRLARRRGSRSGRGPAPECAAGSAGRGAAYPNYAPIITTMPPICYHLQIGSVQLNSLLAVTHAGEKNNKKTCIHPFFFLLGRLLDALNKHVIQMQIHCCLTQIVALWLYFSVDIQMQES